MTRPRTHDRFLITAAGLLLSLALTAPAESAVTDAGLFCDLTSPAGIGRAFARGFAMPISAYDDDPFVEPASAECVADQGFLRSSDGWPVLGNARVTVNNESKIYRFDTAAQEFKPFAWNPWPWKTIAGADGSFRFPDEPRFPVLTVERGADGKPILVDGLQVWHPVGTNVGATTAFEAANKVKDAAEDWAGRPVDWGVNGILDIEPQVYIDFNAHYSPSARMLFFGVVPYRLPGTTSVRMFETATAWELAAHEAGHAVKHALKPNLTAPHPGEGIWGESFSDQVAMWTSLRDPGRVRRLLGGPSLAQSNALSILTEAFGVLVGQPGTGMRDAVNDATLSTTEDEVHEKSLVLTGAVYRLFLAIYEDLRPRQGDERALAQAGSVMGTILAHTSDYMPEDFITLEDVGKAHLKVDAEMFGGRYRALLVQELERREIFDAGSLSEWLAHEAALPDVHLPYAFRVQDAEKLLRQDLDRLGIGPDFGLVVQSLEHDARHRRTILRVQLTLGRGAGATPLANHGVLVFRRDGSLADYHPPVPPDLAVQAQARALVERGLRLGLDRHGVDLAIARQASGALGVEARVLSGRGPNSWIDVHTLDLPDGERHALVSRCWGGERQTRELERAGIVISPEELH